MADQQNTIKTTVELDASQAQQEIVKLNQKASDSTLSLQERLDAKNKAVELQNALSKKTIDNLEKEVKTLEKVEGAERELESAVKKLNAEKLKATKLNASGEKAQRKLESSLADSKNATKNLDDATGGLLGKMKAFVANPIGAVILVLVGAFKFLSEAVSRSSEASESFAKVGAALSGVFNGLLAAVEPVVVFLGDTLVKAITKPKQIWEDFIDSLNSGYQFVKNQIVDRFSASMTILSGGFESNVLKMRIAWNEFTGDDAEADKLKESLKEVTAEVKEAEATIIEANLQIANTFNSAVNSVVEFGKNAKDAYLNASNASDLLANKEKNLAKNRIALEKQQLKSLRIAEEERQIRDDVSIDIEERIAANKRLGEALEEQSELEIKIAKNSLSLALAQKKATGDTVENINAVGDAEIKLLEIQERITGQRSEQLVNENSLLKERDDLQKADAEKALQRGLKKNEAELELSRIKIDRLRSEGEETLALELELLEQKRIQDVAAEGLLKEEIQAINDQAALDKAAKEEEARIIASERQLEIDELELEAKRIRGENVLALELELLEKKRLQEVSIAGLTADEILIINQKYANAKAKIDKTAAEVNKKTAEQQAEAGIGAAAEVFGVSQELRVAEMIMAAPSAVAGSFERAAKTYAPPLSLTMGALGAAGTLVPIIKGLADIKKTRFSKKKSSSSSSSGSISTSVSAGSTGSPSSSISPDLISDIAANNAARLGIDPSLGSTSSANAANNVSGSSNGSVVFSESKYGDFKNQVEFKEEKTTI